MSKKSIEGKTLRFQFNEGAMKGKTFDHVFAGDKVTWGAANAKTKSESKGALINLGDERYIGSYMSEQGNTLTCAINLKSGELNCFASDGKSWSEHAGKVERV